MIKIEKAEVAGIEPALRAMRNPLDSWDKSDSGIRYTGIDETPEFHVGEADMELALRLVRAGTDHSKFMRMIVVYCDVTAPLYWWKEADTYRAGVEKNSCSTMHTLHKYEITRDMFSLDSDSAADTAIIGALEYLRKQYLQTQDRGVWRHMVQLLPESFNQKRTMMISYAALRAMYRARRHHKLLEWRNFCAWIETLPYSRLITEGICDDYN